MTQMFYPKYLHRKTMRKFIPSFRDTYLDFSHLQGLYVISRIVWLTDRYIYKYLSRLIEIYVYWFSGWYDVLLRISFPKATLICNTRPPETASTRSCCPPCLTCMTGYGSWGRRGCKSIIIIYVVIFWMENPSPFFQSNCYKNNKKARLLTLG